MSPRTRESPLGRIRVKDGVYPVAQLLEGGI